MQACPPPKATVRVEKRPAMRKRCGDHCCKPRQRARRRTRSIAASLARRQPRRRALRCAEAMAESSKELLLRLCRRMRSRYVGDRVGVMATREAEALSSSLLRSAVANNRSSPTEKKRERERETDGQATRRGKQAADASIESRGERQRRRDREARRGAAMTVSTPGGLLRPLRHGVAKGCCEAGEGARLARG